MNKPNIRVTHITRPENSNRHAHITKVWSGDSSWTLQEAITEIKLWLCNFYVKDEYGDIVFVKVIPKSALHIEHLRTWADGIWKDNLLNLPRR
jgi:hypothetical protein